MLGSQHFIVVKIVKGLNVKWVQFKRFQYFETWPIKGSNVISVKLIDSLIINILIEFLDGQLLFDSQKKHNFFCIWLILKPVSVVILTPMLRCSH